MGSGLPEAPCLASEPGALALAVSPLCPRARWRLSSGTRCSRALPFLAHQVLETGAPPASPHVLSWAARPRPGALGVLRLAWGGRGRSGGCGTYLGRGRQLSRRHRTLWAEGDKRGSPYSGPGRAPPNLSFASVQRGRLLLRLLSQSRMMLTHRSAAFYQGKSPDKCQNDRHEEDDGSPAATARALTEAPPFGGLIG